jgi:hypothetical protein
MRNHAPVSISVSILALALALPACSGTPPAPEGFQLAMQLENVSIDVIDTLRLTFTPDESMAPADFEPIDVTTYEDGGITVEVDGTGILVITLTGDYARSIANTTDPNNVIVVLEIWSDDDAAVMRRGPQVRATATRETEQIATGAITLPGWPLVLGAGATIRVPCRMGLEARCQP